MFELFLEFSEVNTLYAIYTGILLGLTLKYFWLMKNEYWGPTPFSNHSLEKNIPSPQMILKKYSYQLNQLFNWIIQIVRRKEESSDETDSSVYFFI